METFLANGRGRIRDVLPNVRFGKWPVGKLNSITDVPGVLVSVQSLHPTPEINTGVTVILPRSDWYDWSSPAGIFRLNGCGELTGTHWIEETGLLNSPIVITGTSGIGQAFNGLRKYVAEELGGENRDHEIFTFPVVGETYDGFLSHQNAFALKSEDVVKGVKMASSERVPEGNTGGGTGMICHHFKGGTGSSSRVVKGLNIEGEDTSYTVGVLLQANYGHRENLRIAGVPVGRILAEEGDPSPIEEEKIEARKDGSIIIVLATDAPLHGLQLQRLAKRCALGLAKVGGYASNSSGDIFLAFSTATKVPTEKFQGGSSSPYVPQELKLGMSDDSTLTGLMEAAADATEEAVYNALCMAETMEGKKGRRVRALDLERLRGIFGRLPEGWW
ncbi:DmpA/ArgJ-like protein [Sarocladium strictum]